MQGFPVRTRCRRADLKKAAQGEDVMIGFMSPRSLGLAGVFFGAFTLAAAAQQQPPQPLPPGSPMIGRPDNEAAAKLAPVAPPPIPAAADKLPIDKLKLPPGFNIEVYACGMANARSLRHGRQGHGVRRQPPGRQGLRHRRQGRQARGQGALHPGSIGRTASPSTTARSTSPSCRRSPRSRRSRTSSTTRRSRS